MTIRCHPSTQHINSAILAYGVATRLQSGLTHTIAAAKGRSEANGTVITGQILAEIALVSATAGRFHRSKLLDVTKYVGGRQ